MAHAGLRGPAESEARRRAPDPPRPAPWKVFFVVYYSFFSVCLKMYLRSVGLLTAVGGPCRSSLKSCSTRHTDRSAAILFKFNTFEYFKTCITTIVFIPYGVLACQWQCRALPPAHAALGFRDISFSSCARRRVGCSPRCWARRPSACPHSPTCQTPRRMAARPRPARHGRQSRSSARSAARREQGGGHGATSARPRAHAPRRDG